MSPISSSSSVPPSASSKRPFLRCVGAGERALFVAEELRLDQRFGQRAATDLDERLPRPQRVVVDGLRDELLAGARLAADEDGRVGARHLHDLLADLPHRAARSEDVREVVALAQLVAQAVVLVDEPLAVRLESATASSTPAPASIRRHHRTSSSGRSCDRCGRRARPRARRGIAGTAAPARRCRSDRCHQRCPTARCSGVVSRCAPTRSASIGSWLTRGTTTGRPLSKTCCASEPPSGASACGARMPIDACR